MQYVINNSPNYHHLIAGKSISRDTAAILSTRTDWRELTSANLVSALKESLLCRVIVTSAPDEHGDRTIIGVGWYDAADDDANDWAGRFFEAIKC